MTGQPVLPPVKHPKGILFSGCYFEVYSYLPLTDTQARRVVAVFLQSYRLLKKDKGSLFKIPFHGGEDQIALL